MNNLNLLNILLVLPPQTATRKEIFDNVDDGMFDEIRENSRFKNFKI